jgi:mannose-1-phosphate guanylyltransferase
MHAQLNRVAVIMAGGSGERFWPLSRADRPKQLLRLSSPTATMLEEAVERIIPLFGAKGVYVSTSAKLAPHIVAAGVVPEAHVLAEPLKRNTLGALVWSVAALLAEGRSPETGVAILTADHRIAPPAAFRACVEDALAVAETEGGLVTIGIRPDRPETGYGYIEADLGERRGAGYAAKSFREKPDLATAKAFVASGSFLWNSGMFFFTLGGFRQALEETQPDARTALDRVVEALTAGDQAAAQRHFEQVKNESIDYAVMERAPKVSVLPSRFDWDDLGAWDALERSMPLDPAGNVVEGATVVVDSTGCVVYNDVPQKTVAVLGMHDVIVVCTEDAVLVCPKAQAQRVKEIVQVVFDRSSG